MALLRTVLPTPPSSIVSSALLHRAHLPPHDTVHAIALPSPSSHTSPHGPPTRLKGIIKESEIPSAIGKSAPHGSIFMTHASPDLPAERKVQSGLVVTTTKAQVVVSQKSGKWVVEVTGAKDSDVENASKEGAGCGVEVEVGMFGRAVGAVKEGKKVSEPDYGTPRGALWDVAMIEACLTSDGKVVDLEKLIEGK